MRNVAFVIDHFRIMNVEQFDYLAENFRSKYNVSGFEIFSYNPEYPFERRSGKIFNDLTLIDGAKRGSVSALYIAWKIISEARKNKITDIFLCHYERMSIFIVAVILRVLRVNVFLLQDSKFEDKQRNIFLEFFKFFLYLPYKGALVASSSSARYVAFLGVDSSRIEIGYYTTSVDRMRLEGSGQAGSAHTSHADRPFVCVARFIEKKNHSTLLKAFSTYLQQARMPRILELYGDGPLLEDIRDLARSLGLEQNVVFHGNVGADAIAKGLARSLCLLLPSTEEQFGIVVLEALAMGVPVIVSDRVGAKEDCVRTTVNGFVAEADNPDGWAHFMAILSDSEDSWAKMSKAAIESSPLIDVARFGTAADRILR